jgi:hypothetical protein
MPEPAWKTHDDATDEVKFRLQGLVATCGEGILSLAELKSTCKEQAENGMDPVASGTVELGLFLSEDDYEDLKSYARSLDVILPKVRRSR